MSVYKHEQGTYRSYRVARSISGHLRQQYFPRTREGLNQAKELDKEWEQEQSKARKRFGRDVKQWRKPKRPLSVEKRNKIADPAKMARLLQQLQDSRISAHH